MLQFLFLEVLVHNRKLSIFQLQKDFDLLHPDKSQTFLTRWPFIRSRLFELLQGPRMPKKGPNCAFVQELKHLQPGTQMFTNMRIKLLLNIIFKNF